MTNRNPGPPAGWYPSPKQPGQNEYFDGQAWTGQFSATGAPAPPGAPIAPAPEGKTKKPLWKRKIMWPVYGVLGIGIISPAAGGGSGGEVEATAETIEVAEATTTNTTEAADAESSATTVDSAAEEAPARAEVETLELVCDDGFTQTIKADDYSEDEAREIFCTPLEPESEVTPAQANAIGAAEGYINFKGFSRDGLIGQLSSEFGDQYDLDVATFAVDSLDIDYNEQAVRSAEDYLSFKGFSRDGLIGQLSSESGDQYTVEQATFGVDALETDYNEQAARSAESYLEFSEFSCQGLIDQLSSDFGDEFTVEQATFGADSTGIC